jgi:Ras family
LGNKLDKEPERKVSTAKAQQWLNANSDILFFETSAKEAFQNIAKKSSSQR